MPTNYYQALDGESDDTEPRSTSEIETTLVPKSLVGEDVEVGDTVKLKVEHIYEDEVEVSLVSSSEEDESEEESEEPEESEVPMSSSDEIDMMSMSKG